MTQDDPHDGAPAVPDPDLATSIARALGEFEAHEQRAAALRPANKAALFDALAAAGITSVRVRLWGGGWREAPCIWFSGFWSQGDGACWEGIYSYRCGAIRDIRAHAPQDRELHRIADTLQEIQRRHLYQLRADVTHRGQYHHEYSMAVTVRRDSPTGQDMSPDAPAIVTQALRDLARWLYGQLQAEYDYLASDDAVDETIAANDYTFTADGRRFG